VKIKCKYCGKEIETEADNNLNFMKNDEPSWYGKYIADKCIDVICKDCIKDPERKTEYKGEKQ